MITDKDIQKMKKVFATKEDLKDLKKDLSAMQRDVDTIKEDIDELGDTMNGGIQSVLEVVEDISEKLNRDLQKHGDTFKVYATATS